MEEGVFKTRPGYGVFEMAFTTWAMVHGIAMLRIGHLRHYPGDIDAMELEALRRIGAGLMAELPSSCSFACCACAQSGSH